MVSDFDRNLSCTQRSACPRTSYPEIYEMTKTIIGDRKWMNITIQGKDTLDILNFIT